MIKQLENQIRNLQRELADVKREIAALRLQPCKGDAEIRKKKEQSDELDRRARTLNENLRELTRKLQLSIAQSNRGERCDSPDCSDS